MAGNSPIPYRKIKRAFERGGAVLVSSTGSHFTWELESKPSTLPVHGNNVKAPYINRTRKLWNLTVKDGVSDKDFWNGSW